MKDLRCWHGPKDLWEGMLGNQDTLRFSKVVQQLLVRAFAAGTRGRGPIRCGPKDENIEKMWGPIVRVDR